MVSSLTKNKKSVISILGAVFAILTIEVHAELKQLDDATLSDVTGQAFIAIDENNYATGDANVDYLRINLGLKIETQLNADRLEFGNYEREDPYGEARDADIIFDNFSLGTIYDEAYYASNPRVAKPLKSDGTEYSDGEIVPFSITDPFLEFALDKTTGRPVGVRLGLGEAQGLLSASIQSLTGDLNIDVLDRGEGLTEASSDGNIFDQLVVLLAPYLTSGDPLEAKAVLLDADGNPDPIRATMAGIPNGEEFVIRDTNFFTRFAISLLGPVLSSEVDIQGDDIYLTVQDCAVIGINTCFNLDTFNTLAIGEQTMVGDRSYLTGPESGAFLAFQSRDLKWLRDVSLTNPSAEDFVDATRGAYLNVPNGLTLNLNEAFQGIERAQTEYIDRGVGLF
ncbi:hypothetical protein OLMES_3373 [Oleiphilus messinensis]|uniref:DUF6160 domain-containing protein n=1 Tax=Oleiphilus messinensis TaxID=141451 RepID=A0A1Y0IAC4_9GAMM|nr:DUF6160 family protein [Oleiphilus messinensis]ARU57411.1 hypothetical protein OLMES_3373 [Oleiphilus messinensis]